MVQPATGYLFGVKTASLRRTSTPRLVAKHPGLVKLGQWGWFAKGVVYVLAGVLALIVTAKAFGATVVKGKEAEASPTGALNEVANAPGGRILLVALAFGLALYAGWRLLTAFLPGQADAEKIAIRIGYVVSAIIYGGLGLTATALARHPYRRANGNKQARAVTARILGYPLGRILLGTIAIIAIVAGLYRCVKAVKGDVTEELRLSEMSPARARWTKRMAILGELGRGIAIALIGFFLLRSAILVSSREATGLDGALKRVARVPLGRALVLTVAVSFLLYGVMCVETFRYRKFRTP